MRKSKLRLPHVKTTDTVYGFSFSRAIAISYSELVEIFLALAVTPITAAACDILALPIAAAQP
jgi:hypothetical protein